MVFARAKLLLEENCFEEEPGAVEMKFVGPNITRLYNKAYEFIKSCFHVADSDIQETTHHWGKSEKGEKFRVRWWMHKDMDLFTYLYIRFTLSGQGDSESGSATLEVRGLLRTEYPQDTVWQRSLFYEMLRTFWHRVFYHRKREDYAEECRNSIIIFQRQIYDFFDKLKQTKTES